MEFFLKKFNKYDQFKNEIKKLKLIRALRNYNPIHDTNQPLIDLLREYDMKYPQNEIEWCDLSIFVIQEISKILKQISQGIVTNC